ncbi:MAG: hypothetical protein ACI9FJ_002067 [Alteromonadaceae bacterium]|jgi:hypothetical protein
MSLMVRLMGIMRWLLIRDGGLYNDAFTDEQAWEAALGVIAGVMIGGANCEYTNFSVWKERQ